MQAISDESFDDRITRERAECHARYLALYNGVAAHLAGWKVTIDNPDDDFRFEYRYRLTNNVEGQDIHLSFGSGVDRGKVRVSGSWPKKGEHGPWSGPGDLYPCESSPSINCALSRGYDVIAKDITRRFLPEYRRIWGLLVAKIDA